MPEEEDAQQLRLGDGRILGFASFGDSAGSPVLYCHGFPGSRLEARLAASAALDQGVHLLAVDRPGYGLSTPQPGRRLSHWPGDVLALADHLGLKRFRLLGVSGGGPYALACAHGIPERVAAVATVCGLGPTTAIEGLSNMRWAARTGLRSAHDAPWVAKSILRGLIQPLLAGQAERLFPLLALVNPEPDRSLLRRRDIQGILAPSMRESVRGGSEGMRGDLALFGSRWDFALGDVEVPVRLWHGELDRTVPVGFGRYLCARLPHCHGSFLPDEGHYSLPIQRSAEILRDLLQ